MKRIHNIIILTLFFLITQSIHAQENKIIQVEFEIDGSHTPCDFSKVEILLSTNGQQIKPLLLLNGFIIPDIAAEEIDVCFIYRKKKYIFPRVHHSKFSGQWIFGVDKMPFKKEWQADMKGVKAVRFIRFAPKESLETNSFILMK